MSNLSGPAISVSNASRLNLAAILGGHGDSVNSIAFSPDGRFIASGSDSGAIQMWDAQTGQIVTTFMGHTNTVYSVAFSPNGQMLASGSWDGTIRLWNVQTGQTLIILRSLSPTDSLAFNPNGNTLASGSWNANMQLWDVRTGQIISTGQDNSNRLTRTVAFSPDGRILASDDFIDKSVRLWNVSTNQAITALVGHTGLITSLAFSPSGAILASGSYDNTIRLWDMQTDQTVMTLQGTTDGVSSIAFSPDGNILVSGGWDRAVRLWDVHTGQSIAVLSGNMDHVRSVAFSPNGKLIASGSDDGLIRLWLVPVTSSPSPSTLATTPISTASNDSPIIERSAAVALTIMNALPPQIGRFTLSTDAHLTHMTAIHQVVATYALRSGASLSVVFWITDNVSQAGERYELEFEKVQLPVYPVQVGDEAFATPTIADSAFSPWAVLRFRNILIDFYPSKALSGELPNPDKSEIVQLVQTIFNTIPH